MKKFYFLFCLSFIFSSSLHAQKAAPVAVNDTVHIVAGQSVNVMVLNNDYDADGDSIWITLTTSPPHGQGLNMLTYIKYTCENSYFGLDSMNYRITDGGAQSNWAKIYFVIEDCHCFDSVNVNNINAAANPNGLLFWDKISSAYFEVPRGSNIHSCFISSINIAAKDPAGIIHAAGQCYESSGPDYQAGPVADVYDSTYFIKWQRMWKVTRQQINDHINNWYIPGYNIPEVIANWPAHGDTTKGENFFLASFVDYNHDGVYNPDEGDYPEIRGDMALYIIYNDDTPQHFETPGGLPLRVEIHAMMYAFSCQQDSALWNSLFLNYEIINRSSNQYDSTYVGMFSDFDIGFADDDYIGCDVQRSTIFSFNGDSLDMSTSYINGYGTHPPALGLTLLKGPRIPGDGVDNPAGIDDGINGFGFGDGIEDNECMGMRFFLPINRNSGTGYIATTDPVSASEYFQMLQGRWKDSTQMVYGGVGYYEDTASCGPVCRYAYPGDSDPLHWGTDYQTPNCNINDWTEVTLNNAPFDRRGFLSTGSLSFNSGDSINLDFVYVFGRDYVNLGNLAAIPVMQQRIDSVRKYFLADATPCGLGFSGITNQKIENEILIYPNPASDILNVECKDAYGIADVNVFDMYGRIVLKEKIQHSEKFTLNLINLKKGVYLINVNGKYSFSKKFVKL
ncbi:MAG: T9SS type A sorting domain-containing protein [Bacteroidota bacterium]